MKIYDDLTASPEEDIALYHFRDLLLFSPDVICTFSDDGRFLFVSAASKALWGHAPEELTGTFYHSVVVEEDHQLTAAAAARTQSRGKIVDFENLFRCKGGRIMPMLWRARWDPQKRVIYAVGRDITERKLAIQKITIQERNLRRAYQSANLAWWEYDFTTRRFIGSDEFFLLFGLPLPADRRLSLAVYLHLLHPDDRADAERVFTLAGEPLANPLPGPVLRYRHRLLKPGGEMLTVLHAVEITRNEEGKMTGLHGTTADITESQYYQQLEKLEREVLEMNALPNRCMHQLLTVYLKGIESLHYGMHCSIMEVKNDRLYPVAAPSLPKDYLEALEGLPIGDDTGLCGTAAFRKEEVVVTDLRKDSPWRSNWALAARHRLLSCRSLPILDSKGAVMATFDCYYRLPKKASALEENTIRRTGNILKIIFECYRRELALAESNLRYEMVTRATNEAIWDWDILKDEATYGEGFYTLFGHDLRGQHLDTAAILSLIHPDDAGRVSESITRAVASSANTWTDEFRFRKADGSYASVVDKAILIRDESGRVVRMVGATQDITAQKAAEEERRVSEERYKLVFFQSPIPKLIFEAESLRIVSVNEAAISTYGYNMADFLELSILDLLNEDEHPAFIAAIQQSDEEGLDTGTFRCHRKKDGTLFYVDMRQQKLHLESVAHILVSIIDMTEKLRLQQKLIEEKIAAQKEVARVIIDTQEKERSVIGKELHDNVNQLLTTAKLYVENIKYVPAQAVEFADKGVSLLLRAINEIRFLSRQLVTPDFYDIGFEATLIELADHYLALGLFNVDMQVDINEISLSQELRVTLYRIVQEQLNNIVKYAQASEVQVILLQQGTSLRLQVSDNGVGFDSQKTSKGLGLRNIRNRAEAYRGTVLIETAPGKGCTLVAQFDGVGS